MGTKRNLNGHPTQTAAQVAAAWLFAAALVMVSAMAMAQDAARSSGSKGESENVFQSIGRWFEEQGDKISSAFKDAGKNVENFGHEAGVAARTTVDSAKDAADAVVRIPSARVISGHEKCKNAPNGAPDCVAAASSLCRAKGFESGKSVDMTTAEVCSAQVYLSGRNSGPGCRTETFVSRALCQ